jgi:transcription termination factor Rho
MPTDTELPKEHPNMSVLSRDALEASPLADLHAIASELGIDGFRRLRKAALVDAILEHQGGEAAAAPDADAADAEETRPRRRRGGRGRGRKAEEEAEPEAETEPEAEADADADADVEVDVEAEEPEEEAPARPARRRGGRSRTRAAEAETADEAEEEEREERPARRRGRTRAEVAEDAEPVVEGVMELAGNGAGFLRLGDDGAATDDDVYVSAAQVRRCELVDGDRVSGPARRPRRSERYPSLVRVDTINGAPADEVAAGTPFDELPAAWPTERFALDSEDPTLKAIEWLTPIGRGSRATIVGPARSGKSQALRRLAGALSGQEGVEASVVLVGVRPEEATEWQQDGPLAPAAALSFAAGADAQAQAIDRAVDTAKRLAARGGDAVLLIDTLDGVHAQAARKALAAARNIAGGGSLTVIATAAEPIGGETTVIALDRALTAAASFPALDLAASGTLRAELLVGDAGAEAISKARA